MSESVGPLFSPKRMKRMFSRICAKRCPHPTPASPHLTVHHAAIARSEIRGRRKMSRGHFFVTRRCMITIFYPKITIFCQPPKSTQRIGPIMPMLSLRETEHVFTRAHPCIGGGHKTSGPFFHTRSDGEFRSSGSTSPCSSATTNPDRTAGPSPSHTSTSTPYQRRPPTSGTSISA